MLNTEQIYFDVGQSILQRRGRVFTEKLQRGMMGLPGKKAYEFLIEAECLDATPDELTLESDEIFSSLLPSRLNTMPGLVSLLDYLDDQRLPRCVATSSRRVFAESSLNLVGVLPKVDFIVTAEDVQHGKPAPDIYLLAARKMGLTPNQMLVLEDSQHGCRAGVRSGACTVAVPGDHSRDHDFSGSHFVATSLSDPRIRELLAKQPNTQQNSAQ